MSQSIGSKKIRKSTLKENCLKGRKIREDRERKVRSEDYISPTSEDASSLWWWEVGKGV